MARWWRSKHDYAEQARIGKRDATRCDNCLGKTRQEKRCNGCVITGDVSWKDEQKQIEKRKSQSKGYMKWLDIFV